MSLRLIVTLYHPSPAISFPNELTSFSLLTLRAIVTAQWCDCVPKAYASTCAQSMLTHGADTSEQRNWIGHTDSYVEPYVRKCVHTHIRYSHVHTNIPTMYTYVPHIHMYTHNHHTTNMYTPNIHACTHTYTTHMYSWTQHVHTACTHIPYT